MGQKEKVAEVLTTHGLVRVRDLLEVGVCDRTIRRMIADGQVRQVDRGILTWGDREPEDWETLAQVVLKAPKAVVALTTAAQFHQMTLANSPHVWVALPFGTSKPVGNKPVIKAKYWRNEEFFAFGIETHEIAGVAVRITDKARTVVDMLRPQNRMPHERQMDVLGHYLDEGEDTDRLLEYGQRLGIEDVVRNVVRTAQCLRT
jgi:predicted transcriptional regulator of viral defense system